jgi:hypothetical protein
MVFSGIYDLFLTTAALLKEAGRGGWACCTQRGQRIDRSISICVTTHLLRIELIRLLLVIMWNVVEWCPTPLQWLCEVTGYCRELVHAVVHVQWVTCLVSMQVISASRNCVQILATWLCVIMLKHEVMVEDECTTVDLRILSRYLCAFKFPSIKLNCFLCS